MATQLDRARKVVGKNAALLRNDDVKPLSDVQRAVLRAEMQRLRTEQPEGWRLRCADINNRLRQFKFSIARVTAWNLGFPIKEVIAQGDTFADALAAARKSVDADRQRHQQPYPVRPGTVRHVQIDPSLLVDEIDALIGERNEVH